MERAQEAQWRRNYERLPPTLQPCVLAMRELGNALAWAQPRARTDAKMPIAAERLFTPDALIAAAFLADEIILDGLQAAGTQGRPGGTQPASVERRAPRSGQDARAADDSVALAPHRDAAAQGVPAPGGAAVGRLGAGVGQAHPVDAPVQAGGARDARKQKKRRTKEKTGSKKRPARLGDAPGADAARRDASPAT